MVNDTTTLNGALSELGETMAANITTKGVTASASDGLTTLAGKILQISGGGGSTTLFEDACDSSAGLTNYANSISLRNSGTSTLTYDTSNNCYNLTNTKSSSESMIEIEALYGITDDFKFTMQSKADENCNSLCIYFDSNNWYTLKVAGSYDMWIGKKVNGTYTETEDNQYIQYQNTVITCEFIVENSKNLFSMNFYNNNGDLVGTKSQTIPTITSTTRFGMCSTWSLNRITYIYDMKAEYLGTPSPSSDCSQYQTEINNAIEYINGSGN